MLAAAQRVRHRADFSEVVRGGRRAGRGSLVVHLLLPPGPAVTEPGAAAPVQGARAGFIVSKAVGDAVTRNTVRRRLRHLVRPRLAGLPAGATVVVRALPPAAGCSSAQLATDLDAALAAAHRPSGGRGPRRTTGAARRPTAGPSSAADSGRQRPGEAR